MEYVGVAALKAKLSMYLARVREGEEVIVSDRGRPIAKLVPVLPTDLDDAEMARLRDLERRGLIKLGTMHIPDSFWEMPRPKDPTASVRKAVEEERAEGW